MHVCACACTVTYFPKRKWIIFFFFSSVQWRRRRHRAIFVCSNMKCNDETSQGATQASRKYSVSNSEAIAAGVKSRFRTRWKQQQLYKEGRERVNPIANNIFKLFPTTNISTWNTKGSSQRRFQEYIKEKCVTSSDWRLAILLLHNQSTVRAHTNYKCTKARDDRGFCAFMWKMWINEISAAVAQTQTHTQTNKQSEIENKYECTKIECGVPHIHILQFTFNDRCQATYLTLEI